MLRDEGMRGGGSITCHRIGIQLGVLDLNQASHSGLPLEAENLADWTVGGGTAGQVLKHGFSKPCIACQAVGCCSSIFGTHGLAFFNHQWVGNAFAAESFGFGFEAKGFLIGLGRQLA